MNSSKHTCTLYSYGTVGKAHYLVMDLMGRTLAEIKQSGPRKTFSWNTSLRIAIQCIEAVEEVHSIGYLHRDIKPDNLAIDVDEANARTIYLLDFGLARRYLTLSGEVRKARLSPGFRGTTLYSSVTANKGKEAGRVDDLWSVMYSVIECMQGALPWDHVHEKDIVSMKENMPNQLLLENAPGEMAYILNYLKSMKYEDQPHYKWIISVLEAIMQEHEYQHDDPYDWQIPFLQKAESLQKRRKFGSIYVMLRKYEVYTLNWENDTLDASTLVAAPNAGTIAITSAQSFGSEAKDNSAIRLYRQDGNFIAKIELPSFSLLYFAWTSVTRLLCVSTTGRVLVYSSQGKRKPECSFNMGREALEMGIESCQVFRCQKGKTGLAVLCKTGRFYLTNDCEEVTLWRTREVMGKAASPNCWTVLSKDEQTKVFCAFGNEVYILSREFPSEHVVLPFPTVVKSYTALSISPDKLKVALLSGEGLVQVCSSSFTDIYCEFYSAVGPNVRYFLW
ncbi:hypothetical protein D918_06809 [Trichuris suis]|nr:hypothetical protein D918_06809 [Trichuris suis]